MGVEKRWWVLITAILAVPTVWFQVDHLERKRSAEKAIGLRLDGRLELLKRVVPERELWFQEYSGWNTAPDHRATRLGLGAQASYGET